METSSSVAHAITVNDVCSVYSGRAQACCCGCAGVHRYASALRAEASEVRGYPVTDDDISDRRVKAVLNKIQKNADNGTLEYVAGDHVACTVGQTIYIAYLSRACIARLSGEVQTTAKSE